MALSADKERNIRVNSIRASNPIQASSTIYVGAAVSRDSGGEVGPIASGEAFAGFALEQKVGGTAGDTDVELVVEGVIDLAITGLGDNDDIGDTVYASDDATFTLTAGTNVAIGKVLRRGSGTTGQVYFQGDSVRSL